jgi:membrane protein
MVATLGFLLIVSLMINSVVLAFSTELTRILPDVLMIFFDAINFIITFFVLMTLFAIVYKVLPDVEIEWKNVKAGSFFTAALFMLGKYLIGFYITFAGIGSIYGAAGTIIIIAVWVYYSAAILFFGAEYTWAYAKLKGLEIKPSKFAVSIKQIEIEQGKKPVDLVK